MLRLLIGHAIELGWMTSDPTQGIKRARFRTVGYPTRTEEQIAAFEAKRPPGDSRPPSSSLVALHVPAPLGRRPDGAAELDGHHA